MRVVPRDHLTLDDFSLMLPEVILGAEEENPNPTNLSEEIDPTEGVEEEENESEDPKEEKPSGLKKALEAERARAARAEKQLKKYQKDEDDRKLAEQSLIDQANTREQKANDKVQKLAAGLLKRELDNAIKEAATTAKFKDLSDAIDLVDRSKIVYEQDEDDPSSITIDVKSVEAVVKGLASKKPHFISDGTDDGNPSGSPFGGSKKQKGNDEESLRSLYPSLK